MSRRGSKTEGKKWWVRSPLVTFALLLFLILNAQHQPTGQGEGWSVVGSCLTPGSRYGADPAGAVTEELRPIAWIVRTRDGLRLAPFTEDRVMADSDGIASLRMTRDRSGFWSITRHTVSGAFDLGSRANDFTRAEREHLRTLAAAFVRVEEGGAFAWMAPWFERGDTVTHRIFWLGWLNNAAVIAALALMLASLGWVPRYFRMYVDWRLEVEQWKRWKEMDRVRNTCLHCGYDTRGLPGPRCPECGETVLVTGCTNFVDRKLT